MHSIKNKTIAITGSSSGIGRAAALQLAERGAKVLLLARRADELDAVRTEIEAAGGEAHAYPVDLSDLDALDAAADQILADHGRVDVLVNNAGRSIRRSIEDSFDRFHDYQRCMQINYFAAVKLTMRLLPAMIEAGDGHVVNVLTWGTLMPSPLFSAYIGSKTALEGYSLALGSEMSTKGIDVTTVHFPVVYTPMIKPAKDAYKHMPGISPEQAGGWIVKAVRKRPGRIAPPYSLVTGAQTYLFPRLAQWVVGRLPM